MATPLSAALDARYRAALIDLRQRLQSRLGAMYDEGIAFDDLDASFALLMPAAAALVRAGQSGGVALTTGYLTALVALEAGRPLGTISSQAIADLESLAQGMDAMPALVKQQIGQGVERRAALDFGRYLVERYADAEVTRAVDTHTEAVTHRSGQFSGWEGVVSAKACDPCRANSGFHELNQPIYRHGSCNCTKQYLVAP